MTDAVLDALNCASRAGVPVFFDPGPLMPDAERLFRVVLPLVDTLLINEEEMKRLADEGLMPDWAIPGTVVVKRGAAGCRVYVDRSIEDPLTVSGHAVPVLDTSAAGDCFNAGFIVSYLRGWPLLDCAHVAFIFTNVTDAGLVHLKGLTKLQTLNLSDTNVTDAGLVHLKGLTILQTLVLIDTKVTDAGVKKLQAALPKCRIYHRPKG